MEATLTHTHAHLTPLEDVAKADAMSVNRLVRAETVNNLMSGGRTYVTGSPCVVAPVVPIAERISVEETGIDYARGARALRDVPQLDEAEDGIYISPFGD